MPVIPIWKDKYVNLGEVDAIQYRIILTDSGSVIYSGKAYRKPGEMDISIRINDICADYMQHHLFTLPFEGIPIPLSVTIQVLEDDTWTDVESVQFLNDWSYDYGYNPQIMGMSFPINRRIDSRMPVVWTGFGESVTALISFGGGDFNSDFNSDFSISAHDDEIEIPLVGGGVGMVGTAHLDLAEYPGIQSVQIGGIRYDIVTGCAEFALYYVNAFGGWDCFLIEGNSLEADSLKRYTREVIYDNRDIQNRGIHNYVNEITKGFTFHTGWLLDDQGKMMHHLINSTFVYLYDIANGQMIPVTIPTSSCEYKTYKNQGNRLVNYTIQVEIAQNRIRR